MVTQRERFPPFTDSHFYRKLCLLGAKRGLTVYVFSPERIDWLNGNVVGYSFNKEAGCWERNIYPLPDLIYDRCFFSSKRSYLAYRAHVRRLARHRRIKFLGFGLKGKWQVQELLGNDEEISVYMPETEKLSGASTIKRWMDERGQLFLKPQGGSQGRGIMHIKAIHHARVQYIVKGRDKSNRIFCYGFYGMQGLTEWLNETIGTRNYVVQPYLNLTTSEREPFDIRSFVQKNKRGSWELIGMAVRIGKPGSPTSNLHGGGRAEPVVPFLTRIYGDSAAEEMMGRMEALSMTIARTLEAKHGRLIELGIDLGIDQDGCIWLLEVNSKPGRSVFTQLGNEPAKRSAVSNPIYYACYLWDRSIRRVT